MYDKAAAFYRYEEELKADVVQYLKRGGVFFDVGANIGLISFFVKKFYPKSVIHAFEPGRVVNLCLKQTIAANGIEDFIVITKGVSDKMGTAEFFIDPQSTGGSSLVRKHNENKNIEKIVLISLDEYFAENGVVPSLIKIDVEGAECLVIAGAKKLIKDHHPTFIIESDNENLLKNLNLIKETFKNYLFRPVGKKEFFKVEELEVTLKAFLDQGIKGADYLFIHESEIN